MTKKETSHVDLQPTPDGANPPALILPLHWSAANMIARSETEMAAKPQEHFHVESCCSLCSLCFKSLAFPSKSASSS